MRATMPGNTGLMAEGRVLMTGFRVASTARAGCNALSDDAGFVTSLQSEVAPS